MHIHDANLFVKGDRVTLKASPKPEVPMFVVGIEMDYEPRMPGLDKVFLANLEGDFVLDANKRMFLYACQLVKVSDYEDKREGRWQNDVEGGALS